MASVKRIFRLRSTDRSDEMKAESTLPPAKPGLSCVTRPTPAGTYGVARQIVYETNSWYAQFPDRPPSSRPEEPQKGTGSPQRRGVECYWFITFAKYRKPYGGRWMTQ